MQLPKHICATILHNPHAGNYEPVATWLEYNANPTDDALCWCDITDADRAEILRTGELWTIQWYPDTPVGFCAVGAATFERALERANEP